MENNRLSFLGFLEKQIRPFWKDNELSKKIESELYQPSMFYGALVGYILPPSKAKEFMATNGKMGGTGVVDYLSEMYSETGSWIAYNEDLLLAISKISKQLDVKSSGNTVEINEEFEIDADTENKLFDIMHDKATNKKYVKMLAALDFRKEFSEVCKMVESKVELGIMVKMFYVYRSLFQYAAYGALMDGMVMSVSRLRGATTKKDRKGYLEIINNIYNEKGDEQIHATEMWRIIVKKVKTLGRIQLSSGYFIDYYCASGEKGQYPGQILQISEDGQTDGIKYQAFKKFFTALKKERSS